ncbi:hypothetical protein TYRP_014320 [Tyrophagus putrescentiae]|nr:hypothetical protein TYRP_014320 [Tyrophagus putrescentiae]
MVEVVVAAAVTVTHTWSQSMMVSGDGKAFSGNQLHSSDIGGEHHIISTVVTASIFVSFPDQADDDSYHNSAPITDKHGCDFGTPVADTSLFSVIDFIEGKKQRQSSGTHAETDYWRKSRH